MAEDKDEQLITVSVFERNRVNQHKFKFVDLVTGIFLIMMCANFHPNCLLLEN